MSTGCQCGAGASRVRYRVSICGQDRLRRASVFAATVRWPPGRYWTAVNIHNPDKCKDAHFRLKSVLPNSACRATISQYFRPPKPLGPDATVIYERHVSS